MPQQFVVIGDNLIDGAQRIREERFDAMSHIACRRQR
jgi:hypothetical protein